MELTEQQEKIYLSHVRLLKDCADPAYSEFAIRELDHSYEMFQTLKNLNISKYECTQEDLWLELVRIPVTDLTVDVIENMENKITRQAYFHMDRNTMMEDIIRLQIALGIPIKEEYYSIFLSFFMKLYMEVVSKRYQDRYRQKNTKQLIKM